MELKKNLFDEFQNFHEFFKIYIRIVCINNNIIGQC